jgi:hypothetical protein
MLHEYHVIYSVRYYLLFHLTAISLECITRGYGGTSVYVHYLSMYMMVYDKYLLYCSLPVKQNFYAFPAYRKIKLNFTLYIPQSCKVNHTPSLIGSSQSNFLLSRQLFKSFHALSSVSGYQHFPYIK